MGQVAGPTQLRVYYLPNKHLSPCSTSHSDTPGSLHIFLGSFSRSLMSGDFWWSFGVIMRGTSKNVLRTLLIRKTSASCFQNFMKNYFLICLFYDVSQCQKTSVVIHDIVKDVHTCLNSFQRSLVFDDF